jgi:hypothetical protein
MDVKKVGRIPDGGGWKAHGRAMGSTGVKKRARIGFDYVHSVVDDHTRLAYSEILPYEQGASCAEFLLRVARYFADHGITRIERVMTDNHWSYSKSLDMASAIQKLNAKHVYPTPLPLAEREGGALQPHPANRVGLPAGLHHQHRPYPRLGALATLLQHRTPTLSPRRATPGHPTVMNARRVQQGLQKRPRRASSRSRSSSPTRPPPGGAAG